MCLGGCRMSKKEFRNKCITLLLGAVIAACPLTAVLNPVIVAEAHGGHHGHGYGASAADSCYYHCGGYPAHLHTNGVCPYAGSVAVPPAASGQNTVQQAPVSASVHACGWHQDQVGWWYSENDGQYVRNGKCYIDGHCFLFDQNGYMQTGWHHTGNCWNYYDGNGYMACEEWREIDGKWYYFDSLGSMMTGVQNIEDELYYFDENGIWDGNYYDANLNVISK